MKAALEGSLKRMNTSYIDLCLWHMMDSKEILAACYTKQFRDWVDKLKSEGKIRFFGFSTHSRMEDIMPVAAKLGGFDGIQMTYNFRIMNKDRMKKAVEDCSNAGIGLTAMKTIAPFLGATKLPAIKLDKEERKLLSNYLGDFSEKGLDDFQARLMAVWKNPQIASITSYMPNMRILKANVDAALSWNYLSQKDMNLLQRYAELTAPGYCAGYAHICEPSVGRNIPICDVIRYRMYYDCYGDCDRARSLFREIPADIRRRITSIDYTLAEKRCPQKMPIGILMKEAVVKLS